MAPICAGACDPRAELQGWIDEMQQDGCRNEWVHRTRIIKELKVKCRMNCRMTMDEFQLSVDVIRGKEVLLSKLILTTQPNETFFHWEVDTVFETSTKHASIGS